MKKNEFKKLYNSTYQFETKETKNHKKLIKLGIPICASLVVVIIGGSIAGYFASNLNSGGDNYIASLKNMTKIYNDNNNTFENIGKKSVELIQENFKRGITSSTNTVSSPIGLSLLLSGYALTSNNAKQTINELGYNASTFEEDFASLMESLNWKEEFEINGESLESQIRSSIIYQIIDTNGDKIHFKEDFRKKILDAYYTSTIKSTLDTFLDDAAYAIEKSVDKKLPVPNISVADPSVTAYSVLTLKDQVTEDFTETKFDFYTQEGERLSVTGAIDYVSSKYYYEGETYKLLKFPINYTDLTIILPNEGIDILSIDISDAYSQSLNINNTENTLPESALIKVPFFEVKSPDLDLSSSISILSGEKFSKLIEISDPDIDINIGGIKQTSYFSFSKEGVEGYAVTAFEKEDSTPPSNYIEFICNRPFYAISSYKAIPLFAIQINNPNLKAN